MKKQNKQSEIKTFDEITSGKGYSKPLDQDYNNLLMYLFSDIEINNDMRLLDVGCGSGEHSIKLSKLNFKITGVDISSKAIKSAKENVKQTKLKNLDFCVCDIENLCFDDNTFDICFCGAVLHHFPDIEKVAKELSRVTKIKGKLLAYDPNAHHPYTFMAHNILNRFVQLEGFSSNERALKPKDIQIPFKKAGFSNFKFNSFVLSTSKSERNVIRNLSYIIINKMYFGLGKGNILTSICEKI